MADKLKKLMDNELKKEMKKLSIDYNSFKSMINSENPKLTDYYKNINKKKDKDEQKIICGCGSSITNEGRLKHEKTIKHQKFIMSLNQ